MILCCARSQNEIRCTFTEHLRWLDPLICRHLIRCPVEHLGGKSCTSLIYLLGAVCQVSAWVRVFPCWGTATVGQSRLILAFPRFLAPVFACLSAVPPRSAVSAVAWRGALSMCAAGLCALCVNECRQLAQAPVPLLSAIAPAHTSALTQQRTQ
jgi:hypothetical protein